jgi:lipoyl(octanoyl) transferase
MAALCKEEPVPLTVDVMDLGRISFDAARARQAEMVDALIAGDRDRGVLLLCEHDEVITIGRAGRKEPDRHLVGGQAALGAAGVPLVDVDRGGDVTWHGPGQFVGYPILPLKQLRQDAEWYVRSVEEVIIRALADGFGVEAGRVDGRSGVWVESDGAPAKICALGVAFRRRITFPGFALNVSNDLSRFGLIVPCGIADASVTSLEQCLQRAPDRSEVTAAVTSAFATVFDVSVDSVPLL